MMPVTLNGNNIEKKREEILKYFLEGYETFEKLFEMLKSDEIYYRKSEPTRHPMIFYFGHTAAFFINKLILANVIEKRVNPNFESIFAIGVDEMKWDDLDEKNYNWPKVKEVKDYREKVKQIVIDLINTIPLKLPIKKEDPMWIILMGCEHERIHLETSSVLHRQMPIEFIKEIESFEISTSINEPVKNEMVTIDEKEITLGKKDDDIYYGWDNEYGEYKTKVNKFETSKFLVSNNEYMEFVKDHGYDDLSYWDDEGKEFLKRTKTKHPPFWIPQKNGSFKFRTIMKIIDLPLSWPVEINALEAFAFCKWKSKKENKNYTLPSEEEYYSILEQSNINNISNLKNNQANINLFRYASPVNVNTFDHNGIYDVIGNVWQHCRTPIYPFKGFEVHPVYDDFSVPTFDNKHYLINGGSFISTGNEMIKSSRYAFRRHFYQHAGFRYIIGEEKYDIKEKTVDDKFISYQIKLHTKTDIIAELYSKCINNIDQYNINTILDIGCSIGRGTIELSKKYNNIVGVDTTARIIQEAEKYKKSYKEYTKSTNNIEYWQADPCNLKPNFKNYDLIILNNILDRVYLPISLLQELKNRINSNGIAILITTNQNNYYPNEYGFKEVKHLTHENYNILIWEKL